MMRVVDFRGTDIATDLHELETILSKRYGEGLNAFLLSHHSEKYPTLSILVKGDLAALHYIPREREAGYRSAGKMPDMEPEGIASFSLSETPADDVGEPNESVLPFSVAVSVAREFFVSNRLPSTIGWLEL